MSKGKKGGRQPQAKAAKSGDDAQFNQLVREIQKKITFFSEKMVLSADRKGYADSSDSDDEVEKARTVNPEADKIRRQVKAIYLANIANAMFPSTEGERDVVEKIMAERVKEYNSGKGYSKGTKELLKEWVKDEIYAGSLYHNPYLRRAFKEAILSEKILDASSDDYESRQGRIREKLFGILQVDHKAMQWKREDFSDDKTWKAVDFILNHQISNDKTKKSTGAAILEGQADLSKTSPHIAFHHISWKEAASGAFSSYALNPANLTAMNDQRTSRRDPDRQAGSHQLAHLVAGFCKEYFKDKAIPKGGIFKAIDLEVTKLFVEEVMVERAHKYALYSTPYKASGPAEALAKTPVDVVMGGDEPKVSAAAPVIAKDDGKARMAQGSVAAMGAASVGAMSYAAVLKTGNPRDNGTRRSVRLAQNRSATTTATESLPTPKGKRHNTQMGSPPTEQRETRADSKKSRPTPTDVLPPRPFEDRDRSPIAVAAAAEPASRSALSRPLFSKDAKERRGRAADHRSYASKPPQDSSMGR